MKIVETEIAGLFTVDLERLQDARGFFARVFCENEFRSHGLSDRFVQVNDSYNPRAATLRGLHYQSPPYGEDKLIRCISGALYDVVVDLRMDSPTFLHHAHFFLNAEARTALYVPKGFAHGFLTLEDRTEALYLTSQAYTPGYEHGLRWNDPALGIDWPMDPQLVSEKDRGWPDFDLERDGGRLYTQLPGGGLA